jgi:hypothetical protein
MLVIVTRLPVGTLSTVPKIASRRDGDAGDSVPTSLIAPLLLWVFALNSDDIHTVELLSKWNRARTFY